MVRNAQNPVPLPRAAPSFDVGDQSLPLAGLQDDGLEQARRIRLHLRPIVGIQVQAGGVARTLSMGSDDFFHEALKKGSVAAQREKAQRLHAALAAALGVLAAPQLDQKRTSRVPKPVHARCGQQGELFPAHRRVEVDLADAPKKVLLQKPLFDPGERRVVVLDRNGEGGLPFSQVPKVRRQAAQKDPRSAEEHKKEAAGSELVMSAEDLAQKVVHGRVCSHSARLEWLRRKREAARLRTCP